MTLIRAFSCFLALRYLLARRVTALGVAGVAVAVWALIVVISVFSGFISEIRGFIRGATPDLILTGVQPDCSYEAVRPLLEADSDVVSTAPRLTHYAILFPQGSQNLNRQLRWVDPTGSSDSALGFVVLIGVDPVREAATTEFRRWLTLEDDARDPRKSRAAVDDPARPFAVSADAYMAALRQAGRDDSDALSQPPGMLLNVRRMQKGRGAGHLIDLITARFVERGGAQEVVQVKKQSLAVGGYETRYRTFDSTHAFVDIEFLREILGHDAWDLDSIDLITEVAIRVRDGTDLAAARDRLAAAVQGASGGVVLDWQQQNRVFLDAVDHERAMMKVVLFCVMLVAAFLIYATLHMMVTQKTKDIGVLTSLGATPASIAAIFLLCGGVIATLGCALGAALGVLSAHYLNDFNDWLFEHFGSRIFPTELYDLDRIPYQIEPGWLLQVLGSAFVLSLLVAYLPARRAARLDPVKALSHV